MSNIEKVLKAEVEGMHEVLAAWFRGDVPADRTFFDKDLASRFAETCHIVYPSGSILARKDFLDPVFNAHASNPPFRVAIRDFRLVSQSDDGALAVACYVEDQFNALNSDPKDNARVSTVIFKVLNEGRDLTWLHIHETAMP